MAQNADNQVGAFRTCGAGPGQDCRTRRGKVADKVHWGRPRARAPRPAPVRVQPFAEKYADEIREAERGRYGD